MKTYKKRPLATFWGMLPGGIAQKSAPFVQFSRECFHDISRYFLRSPKFYSDSSRKGIKNYLIEQVLGDFGTERPFGFHIVIQIQYSLYNFQGAISI